MEHTVHTHTHTHTTKSHSFPSKQRCAHLTPGRDETVREGKKKSKEKKEDTIPSILQHRATGISRAGAVQKQTHTHTRARIHMHNTNYTSYSEGGPLGAGSNNRSAFLQPPSAARAGEPQRSACSAPIKPTNGESPTLPKHPTPAASIRAQPLAAEQPPPSTSPEPGEGGGEAGLDQGQELQSRLAETLWLPFSISRWSSSRL